MTASARGQLRKHTTDTSGHYVGLDNRELMFELIVLHHLVHHLIFFLPGQPAYHDSHHFIHHTHLLTSLKQLCVFYRIARNCKDRIKTDNHDIRQLLYMYLDA
jgi:hypothetical protein